MANWIELREKGKAPLLWERFASTSERRVFLLYESGEVEFPPLGTFKPGYFQLWHLQAIGFIRILPMAKTVTFESVLTREQVPLDVVASLTFVRRGDDEAMLRRIVTDQEEQQKQALNSLTSVVQSVYGQVDWRGARSKPPQLASQILDLGREKLNRVKSPFTIHDVAVLEIAVRDADLPRHPLDEIKAGIRAESELAAEDHKRRLAEKQSDRQDIESARLSKREHDAARMELSTMAEKAKLAATPEGRLVLFSTEAWATERERIRALGRDDKLLLKWTIAGAVQENQIDLARQLMSNHLGVTFSDPVKVIELLQSKSTADQATVSDVAGSPSSTSDDPHRGPDEGTRGPRPPSDGN